SNTTHQQLPPSHTHTHTQHTHTYTTHTHTHTHHTHIMEHHARIMNECPPAGFYRVYDLYICKSVNQQKQLLCLPSACYLSMYFIAALIRPLATFNERGGQIPYSHH